MKKALLAVTVACSLGAPVVATAATASTSQHHGHYQPVASTKSSTHTQPNTTHNQSSSKAKAPGPVSLQSVLNQMSKANQSKYLQAMKAMPTGSTKHFTQAQWKDYIGQWFTESMVEDEAQGFISQVNGDMVTRLFNKELQAWNEREPLTVKVPYNFGAQTWSLWNVSEKTMDINFNA
jgi:hypothetical protein